MEFTSAQIARLVLGYLKTEKCHAAFDAFYNASPHFVCGGKKRTQSKYIVTRILGYSLRELLLEYAEIYSLIQERLEPTDYYETNSSKNLLHQLSYLLDRLPSSRANTPRRSRSSTPIKEANKNRYAFQHDLSVIDEVTSELNTTLLESLPGNSNEYAAGKKRTGIKTNKNTVIEESDSGDSPNHCQDDDEEDIEVLKQTLLEHTELHEKIAENINLLIKPSATEEKVNTELDSAIKAIVEKTEADPVFEKLISDLIYENETSKDTSDTKLPVLQSEQTVPNVQTTTSEPESIKHRLRSPKKELPNKPPQENLTNITSSSNTKLTQASDTNLKQTEEITTPTVDIHKNLTVNTATPNDIILYDGTIDGYMKTAAPTPIISTANPIFYNNNLLMVQPGLMQPAPIISGIPVDKSYYLVNNSQLINVSVPQYKINNVTEQDILNMPTVIVCDDNQQPAVKRAAKSTGVKELPKILPKLPPSEPSTAATNLREYLTLYQCEDSQPQIEAQKLPSLNSAKKEITTQTIQIEILKPPEDQACSKEAESCSKPEKSESPLPKTPEESKQNVKKATPKSGSHVRALDFNLTPGQSRFRMRTTPNHKSPFKKSPNKSSSTKISKSLFCIPSKQIIKSESVETAKHTDEEKDVKIGKTKPPKGVKSWDADLRALMGPVKDPAPVKRRKKGSKKSIKKVCINATACDAKAIEENLKEMDLEVSPNSHPGTVKNEICSDALEHIKEESSSQQVHVVENCDDQSVVTVSLINCNAKPRFKKKCNIDNNVNKSVKITKVKEIKSLEIVPDSNNKMVLSPSKLNANKRSLVENNDRDTTVVSSSVNIPIVCAQEENNKAIVQDNLDNSKGAKFVTPEMPRVPNPLPVSANRNLIPMLETPIKYMDISIKLDELPKTPGVYSPGIDINTPMTKILNEQLRGVDLLSMPTPKFPLTPTFPFTPFNTKSPYPNRSTDYSTSSSYYHPSDSEQNKSIEAALIGECKRFENQKATPEKDLKSPEVMISERISSFNQNLVGRKNLNLVQKDLETSSSSNSSDESLCNQKGTDNESSSDTKNDTVVSKRAETPYMLRSRKKGDSKKIEIQNIVTPTEIKPKVEVQPPLNLTEKILKEVEEKRKRTIAKFKEGEKPPPLPKKKQQSTNTPTRKLLRKAAGKIAKSRKTTTKTVNKRKSKSPVKLPQQISISEERDVMLHLSSDDDNIRPFDVVETELLESSSSSTSHPLTTFQNVLHSYQNTKLKEPDVTSDQEAKILVEGLKQRGIYLVPKKTRNVDKKTDLDQNKSEISIEPVVEDKGPKDNSNNKTAKSAAKKGEYKLVKIEMDAATLKSDTIKPNRARSTKRDAENNDVLEDGEILSDVDDIAQSKNIKDKSIKETSTTKSSRNRIKDESKRPLAKETPSKNDRKSAVKDVKKSDEVPSSYCKQNKSAESTQDKPLNLQKDPAQCPKENIIEQDLNLSDSVCDEVFDDRFYPDETLKIVYDPKNTSGKKISDYDLPVSNKCFVVEVLGHPLEMSVTPFVTIFDLPPRQSSNNKVKILQNTLISSPANLYKQFNKKNVDSVSPLDDLYPNVATSRYSERNTRKAEPINDRRRRNSVNPESRSILKLRKHSRSKSVDCNAVNVVRVEKQSKSAIKSGGAKEKKETEIRDVEGISPLATPKESDDDLMNYAICGSERQENDIEGRSNKRKAIDDLQDSQVKRAKAQDLLDDINVDVFLTKIHG